MRRAASALGGTATSDLKYHINATDITEIGKIVGQNRTRRHARPRRHGYG